MVMVRTRLYRSGSSHTGLQEVARWPLLNVGSLPTWVRTCRGVQKTRS